MPYSEPSNLGIVACPGGAVFAEEVIVHIRHMYKHRFALKADVISNRYNIDKDKFIQEMNFHNDLTTSDLAVRGSTDKYRPPAFKVETLFTWFANGEVKAELLEPVRGKDIYIFQDVENHEPIEMNKGKNTVTFSVNDHVMTLLVTIDAVQQAGAKSVIT